MEAEEILEVARDWSYWDRPVPTTVPRSADLPIELTDRVALAIQGVRRCGKSTLLQQLVGHYNLNPMHCAFVNFEDPRLSLSLSHETLDALVGAFRALHPDDELTFFLDEVHGVIGWERWLRAQLERPRNHRFVITGSNSTLLSGELSSVLTGRHLTIELFPFDLDEVRLQRPDATVESYLRDGGFPGPLQAADGERLLRQYFHDIAERDIRERVGARSSLPIRQLVQMTFETAGSELSLRRVAGAVGIAVDTAASYLDACEAAYLLFSCPYFAYSERKRANRNRKYYPIDTGLRRLVVTPTSQDLGKSLECATFLSLRRQFSDVFYWRDKGEVDFVVLSNGEAVPIQVTWDEPEDRHQRALEAFYEQFPHAGEARFVNHENFETALAF